MKLLKYSKVLIKSGLSRLGYKIPIKVYFFATNNCNFSCPYCLAKEFKRNKEMSTKQIKKVMDEFKKMGTEWWDFCGGEPLIRNDIGELVGYAKKLGFVTAMVTNGTFVKKKTDVVKKLDAVMISLDGPAEVHDSIRGKGAYDDVIEAVKELNKFGIKPKLNAVISKSNYQHIEFLADLTKKYDCFMSFTPLVPQTEDVKEYMLSDEKLLKVIRKIRRLKKSNKRIVVPDEFLQRIEDYVSGKIKRFQPTCIAGQSYVVLSPFGEVALCLDKFHKKELMENIDVKKQFNSLPVPQCDCTYRCYFVDNINYSFSFKRFYKLAKNILLGRGFQ